MKTMKIFSKGNSHSIILRNTFNFVAIITLFSFSACVTPSSVRGKKVYGNKNIQTQNDERLDKRKKVDEDSQESIQSDDYAKLIEEAHKINPPKPIETEENKTESKDISNLLLPLNKQIEILNKNQSEIKSSIKSINNDMTYIKSDIAEIKETLKQLANNKTVASTGVEETETPKPKKSNFVLKSDESAQNEKSSSSKNSKNQDEPLVIKANSNNVTPKKETKNIETPKQDISKNNTNNQPTSNNNQSAGQISDLNKLSFELTENYLQNKDYSKAIAKLKEIESGLTTALEKSKHNYLLGESHFGLQQYQKAIEYFIRVLESPEFDKKEDAKIMIAESQIRNGQTDSAKETFKQLIAEFPKSEHIPRARKMLQKL